MATSKNHRLDEPTHDAGRLKHRHYKPPLPISEKTAEGRFLRKCRLGIPVKLSTKTLLVGSVFATVRQGEVTAVLPRDLAGHGQPQAAALDVVDQSGTDPVEALENLLLFVG